MIIGLAGKCPDFKAVNVLPGNAGMAAGGVQGAHQVILAVNALHPARVRVADPRLPYAVHTGAVHNNNIGHHFVSVFVKHVNSNPLDWLTRGTRVNGFGSIDAGHIGIVAGNPRILGAVGKIKRKTGVGLNPDAVHTVPNNTVVKARPVGGAVYHILQVQVNFFAVKITDTRRI